MVKEFNLRTPELSLYQPIKKHSAEIVPHAYSALRYLGVIFGKSILSSGNKLAGTYTAGTLDSCSGA